MKKIILVSSSAVFAAGFFLWPAGIQNLGAQDETDALVPVESEFTVRARADEAPKRAAATSPDDVKTLDDIRNLPTPNGNKERADAMSSGYSGAGGPAAGGEGDGFESGGDFAGGEAGMEMGMMGMESMSPPDPRQKAIRKLRAIRGTLARGLGDRKELEADLKKTLHEYFLADMQHRVRELDEIKKRVTNMEGKLKRRLNSRDEVVDLQFRLLVHEADGLGFFAPGDDIRAPGGGAGGGSGGFGAGMFGAMGGLGAAAEGETYGGGEGGYGDFSPAK